MRNNIRNLSAFICLLCTSLILANVRGTSLTQVVVPNDGEIIYPSKNSTGMFGNTEIGDEFIHRLNSDMWGSFFECPEDVHAKSITVYVKASGTSRLRCALYEEFIYKPAPPSETRYMRFVMSTEEKIIPPSFEGWVTLNFTAPPPTKKGAVYWICAWSDEYGSMTISTTSGGQGIEWTVYMAGSPHGLGYPRFYEIVPQHRRGPILCSIYCTYDFTPPSIYECPYCGSQFSTYDEVLEHIKSTPTEMIHYQICNECGFVAHLECEMQAHMYMYHSEGVKPTECQCIFCNHTIPITVEIPDPPVDYATMLEVIKAIAEQTGIYSHINDNHPAFTGPPEYEE